MELMNLLKYIYNAKQPCFLSVEEKTYNTWKFLIKILVILNKNYKSCEIYRKKWGEDDMKNAIHSSDSFDNMEHEVEIYTSVPDEDEDEDEDTNKEEPEEPEEDTGSLEDEEKPEEMEGPSEPQPAS
jgi:hypothetical protein